MHTMRSYKQELTNIEKMLHDFLECGVIDSKRLSIMDNIIEWSEKDQIRVVNSSCLPLNAQTSFFGAIRNIHISMKSMKEKLRLASIEHENPTTAQLALELMPSFFNLVPYLEPFFNENVYHKKVENVSKFSRILFRKAKYFGFSEDVMSQLRAAGVTKPQIKSFIESFSKNVALELDIEEEASSSLENTD